MEFSGASLHLWYVCHLKNEGAGLISYDWRSEWIKGGDNVKKAAKFTIMASATQHLQYLSLY